MNLEALATTEFLRGSPNHPSWGQHFTAYRNQKIENLNNVILCRIVGQFSLENSLNRTSIKNSSTDVSSFSNIVPANAQVFILFSCQLLALGEAEEECERSIEMVASNLSCGTRLLNLLIKYVLCR